MDASSLIQFFSHYGLILLYVWLLFGIFIIPVPEEVVMLTTGILISIGDFSYWAYVVACIGSLSGVTFSYFLGHFLGRLVVVKYGKWFGVSEKRLSEGEVLFKHYGKWSLSVGYFVPGMRHLLAVIAGTIHFGWKRYALYAYPAGIVWVVLLVTFGYLAGSYWLRIFPLISSYFYYIVLGLIVIATISFVVYWYRFHKRLRK